MEEDLKRLSGNLSKIRSNRISLEMIGDLLVDYQGKKRRIKDLSSLRANSQRELIIQFSDQKMSSIISKAVLNAQLGYHQSKSTGNEIYFSLLPLTEEIRNDLIEKVKKTTETSKVDLRNSRQKIRDKIKKSKEISQNEQKMVEGEVEKINKKYLQEIEELGKKKIQELKLT